MTTEQITVRFKKEALTEYIKLTRFVEEGKKNKINPSYEQILKSINKVLDNIKHNPNYGDLVPQKYLNKELISRYGTNKIYRVELVGFWRLLYTLIGDEIQIIAIILDFMDHEEYSKLFQYRKK